MQIPDGTKANVTALEQSGGVIKATIDIKWPNGTKAQGWITFAPMMQVDCGPTVSPGSDASPALP